MIYVMSDIHGSRRRFDAVMEQIKLTDEDTLYILGDVIDRGEHGVELLQRIRILMRYRCLPYVMRFERYVESPYRGMYITLARWCNQPAFFKKKSLREFVKANGAGSITEQYFSGFEKAFPEAASFSDLRFGEV